MLEQWDVLEYWNSLRMEKKNHSLVQNKGVAALSEADSNVQPSGRYSKEHLMQQEIFLNKKLATS